MRPHIATVRDQPRGLLEGPLALQQRLPNRRNCATVEAPAPVVLCPNLERDVLVVQPDSL